MNKNKRILLHTTIWLFIVVLFVFVGTSGFNSSDAYIAYFFGMSVLNILVFYINLYLIIPVTLNKRKFLAWFLASVVIILSFTAIKYGISNYVIKRWFLNKSEIKTPEFWQYIFSIIIINGFFTFLSTVYKFTIDWFFNEKEKRDLENQKLVAELAFLKSQINPHFLFNSLNNIYSLAYQKSESTPYAILKLSEILRYMLYESNDARVDLAKEIEYLESFIELQKLRFKGQSNIKLQIKGEIASQQIVPLVLISFVENAFKHGVATDEQNPIEIYIYINANKLLFTIKNKINNHQKDQTGGIGMVNVIRRLEITYPNAYKLNINNENEFYYCELFIDLEND